MSNDENNTNTNNDISKATEQFEKYWLSKPSYKESDKEPELRGWLSAIKYYHKE